MNIFIPESAPFNADQRLWLNGYMAGLLAGKHFSAVFHPVDVAPAQTTPLVILFGSQTGTAEKIAKELAKASKLRGCKSRVLEANACAEIDWSKEENLLIVTSTYGDGDMPDNAQGFWSWLQTDAAKALSHIRFSVLALGDTNYSEFCAAGKKVDERLEVLGARRIHPRIDCDVNYEANAKAWTEGVLSGLAPSSEPAAGANQEPVPQPQLAGSEMVRFDRANPFPARLLSNRRLNADGSEKETRHIEISLEGSELNYEAGDALGVWPINCQELVADLLTALRSDGEEAVRIDGQEFSLRQALTNKLDIGKPAPELLRHFAATNTDLAALLAPERKDELKNWLWGRGVIDLLEENPESRPSIELFVTLLKPLAPRLYSISSSPKAHTGQVHLTINVVRYESYGRKRKGLASTFLADRVRDETPVRTYVQKSHGFRLPNDQTTPVIMVGPGTGVAPFRAFLHERRATAAPGRNWLFFGEQRSATDFYYRDELEPMLRDGHLTRLSTAFSRDQQEKIYVQNRMLESAPDLWSWLESGAHFYVCGDASRMAKDVDTTLHQIVEKEGRKTLDEAKAYVAELKSQKRYQRDVY